MGKVTILDYTHKNPISMIGAMSGVCYGADVSDQDKNYKRGMKCLADQHGRTYEFPDVYMSISGHSARVIREFYTHIGGAPTRLQASTRYINYQEDFEYITPETIANNPDARLIYRHLMAEIRKAGQELEELGIPREDNAMILPLAMESTIACKFNFRTLYDMSHQRKCLRAYWEYRELFKELEDALKEYSPEWKYLVENYFKPKCQFLGKCPESKPCSIR